MPPALNDAGWGEYTTYSGEMYGLPVTDPNYSTYANADFGVLDASFEVDFGATAVTMPSHKSLDGQGFTVTLTASGNRHAHQMWSDRDYQSSNNGPAEEIAIGNLLEGETVRSYVSGGESEADGSHYLNADLNALANTNDKVGASIGGLFMGRNLGTIANINFVVDPKDGNLIQIDNYNADHDSGYGALLVAGAITAVNAGTIENCSLTIAEGVEFRANRLMEWVGEINNELGNDKEGQINTVVSVGGYAGVMFSDNGNNGIIRNSTLDIKTNAAITTANSYPDFTWLQRRSSIISYAGGLVGWMLEGSEVYNVILNGEGDVKAWVSIDNEGINLSNDFAFGVGGIIVGLNSPHNEFNPIAAQWRPNNHGTINGVICNWNGNVEYSAFYNKGVQGSDTTYYDVDRYNYSMGGQIIGVCESDSLQNVYFMYGVENYATHHRDNWYYGSTASARLANPAFEEKYEYILSEALGLMETHEDWDAIYTPVSVGGENVNSHLTPVYVRNADGTIEQGSEFTLTNYANYTTADNETNASIFNGVPVDRTEQWGFQLYRVDLDANGNPTHYYDITRSEFHKIVEPTENSPTTTKDDDRVGARTSGKMTTVIGDGSNALTTYQIRDYSYQYAPNNVYIYEVAFGESEKRELDMNDPQTVASMSFETDQITSDIRLDFELYTDENLAQFIWSIEEEWDYTPESGIQDTSNTTDYYNTVNSLEEAMRNNKFDRTMRRDNDSPPSRLRPTSTATTR